MAGKVGVQKRHSDRGKLEGNKPRVAEIEKKTLKQRFVRFKMFKTARASRIKCLNGPENQGKTAIEAWKIT